MMSSIEHPSGSGASLLEKFGVNDDSHGDSATDMSSCKYLRNVSSPVKASIAPPTNRVGIAKHVELAGGVTIDPHFFDNHLRNAPNCQLTPTMKTNLNAIKSSGTQESAIYKPTASLLTAMSKKLYSTLFESSDVQYL